MDDRDVARDTPDTDDDIAAAGGWFLTAVVVAVLAVGATMAARNHTEPAPASPANPAATPHPAAGAAAPGGATGSAPVGAPARQADARGLDAPPCTRLTSLKSADGRHVLEYAVSAEGSTRCLMQVGDRGEHVAALQRALRTCAGQSIDASGAFGESTAAALSTVQLVKGGAGDGIYGPNTARVLGWPWRDTATGDVIGRCSPAGVQA